jgi:predicted metal-binding protein
VKPLKEVASGPETAFEVVHLGTCVKTAMETGRCPIDYDELCVMLKQKFGVDVVLGTHSY